MRVEKDPDGNLVFLTPCDGSIFFNFVLVGMLENQGNGVLCGSENNTKTS